MVEYNGKEWLRVVLRWTGSVFPRLWGRVLFAALLGALAVYLFHAHRLRVPILIHAQVGIVLGLLLVFRTNASYDRYWEGRKLIGTMGNRTRDLARQLGGFLGDTATSQTLRRRVVLWFRLATQALRSERDLAVLGDLLTAEESTQLAPATHRPLVVLRWITEAIHREAAAGRLTEARVQLLDQNLTALVDALGGAERIVRTPIPFAYAQHIKVFVILYCFTVPFAMVESVGWYAPLASAILAFALIGVDEIGVEIEDPFGYDPNDLPLDAIGDGIAAATKDALATAAPKDPYTTQIDG